MTQDLVIETVDATKRTYSTRAVMLLFVVLALTFLPWLLMHDLFATPENVAAARAQFGVLRDRYEEKSEKWIQKKNEVLATLRHEHSVSDLVGSDPIELRDLPNEVLVAFLQEDLGFSGEVFASLAITPLGEGEAFLLSKEEKSWPKPIVTTLTVALETTPNGKQARFTSLQRGSRSIDPNLAWTYFPAELSRLRAISFLATGTEQFTVTGKSWSLLWRPSTLTTWSW